MGCHETHDIRYTSLIGKVNCQRRDIQGLRVIGAHLDWAHPELPEQQLGDVEVLWLPARDGAVLGAPKVAFSLELGAVGVPQFDLHAVLAM